MHFVTQSDDFRSMISRLLAAALPAALLITAPLASAHIVFEQKQATAGSYVKGVLMVGHGCNGSATKSITVTIPDGVQGAQIGRAHV